MNEKKWDVAFAWFGIVSATSRDVAVQQAMDELAQHVWQPVDFAVSEHKRKNPWKAAVDENGSMLLFGGISVLIALAYALVTTELLPRLFWAVLFIILVSALISVIRGSYKKAKASL